jgi:hypothetical protein
LNISFNPVATTNLCIASVDSASNYNEIYWSKPLGSNIDSFRIYRRQSAVTNVLVGTTGYNDPSYILDVSSGANPNSHFEEYTVTCIDSCGNESDSAMFHRTMFLAPPVMGTGSVTLNWNLYIGQTVNYYRVLRDSTGTGLNWEVIDSTVNPGVTMWVDNNLPTSANLTLLYRVDVDWLTSCDPSRAIINTSRSNIKSQMINTGLAIDKNDISGMISVYPNPAKDQVTIEFKKGMRNVLVEVYDVMGQLVVSERSANNDNRMLLSTSNLANGVYFVRLLSNDGKAMKKLIIEK